MLRVRQIKVSVVNDNNDVLKREIAKKLNVSEKEIVNFEIYKKSIDARKKDDVFFNYDVNVELVNESKIKLDNDILVTQKEEYSPIMSKKIIPRPIIIGFGPAGMIAAYEFAKHGYRPIVYERGSCVEKRIKKIEEFWETGKLDKECNVQFGEGGAGTFSDGKLNTQIKDKENRKKEVLSIFIENGANPEIMYINKPHLGTDKLQDIVRNIREKIINWGGEIHFDSKLTDIVVSHNSIKEIIINDDICVKTDNLILALGHSARETIKMLYKRGVQMDNKPFAIGVRIEHKQSVINKNQYGKFSKYLPSADYKLTYTAKSGRGVYTFCMCPGGYVVNASSEPEKLVVNGMSYSKRDSKYANSAVIVTINQKDYGDYLFAGLKFQEDLEQKAYQISKGNIPVQKLIDFKKNEKSRSFDSVIPMVKGNYSFINLRNILPEFISLDIIEAIKAFDNKIKGFNDNESLLFGVETRTSSSIKFVRDENMESNIKGIFPIGEGAGYSGGITSSAVEGLKIFEQFVK